VGDLHGDSDAARAVLRLAGLIDDQDHWTGRDAVLVQDGDLMDRGPDTRGLIALMRSLQAQAPAAGGQVVQLMGNHEEMSLLGDWRYLDRKDLADYGPPGATTDQLVQARRAALSPTGDEGRWLRSLDAVAIVGDTVFVHGGITARFAREGVSKLDQEIHAAVQAAAATHQLAPGSSVLGEEGPLWYRGYLLADEGPACDELGRALSALHVRRMVVGHTVQKSGRIADRCGGRLLGIDTGISAWYGRHLAALELTCTSIGSPVSTRDVPAARTGAPAARCDRPIELRPGARTALRDVHGS
jgi:Calcineurin-like phosphoesterase.